MTVGEGVEHTPTVHGSQFWAVFVCGRDAWQYRKGRAFCTLSPKGSPERGGSNLGSLSLSLSEHVIEENRIRKDRPYVRTGVSTAMLFREESKLIS